MTMFWLFTQQIFVNCLASPYEEISLIKQESLLTFLTFQWKDQPASLYYHTYFLVRKWTGMEIMLLVAGKF